MIVLNQVSKRFQRRDKSWFDAVHPLSLTIEQGEIFGLMGYSGAGKSTLLRLINLLERPDQGSVAVDGQELTALNAGALRKARQNIGMIFQQFNLLANRNIADNVAYPLEIAGWSKADIQSRVAECLAIVGLTEHADKYPSQLSGGQKQRVGIARALAPRPNVILADEPTSALDPITTRSVLQCLKDINERFNVTIVIVTHEMSVIRRICNRVALLDDGHLVEVVQVARSSTCTEVGKNTGVPQALKMWSLWCAAVELLETWSSPATAITPPSALVPAMLACLNTSEQRSTPGPLPYQRPNTPSYLLVPGGAKPSCCVPQTAVATSQGTSEAFSTGSQAQYPPQPNSMYDHQAPSRMPPVRPIQDRSVKLRETSSQEGSLGVLVWTCVRVWARARQAGIVKPA